MTTPNFEYSRYQALKRLPLRTTGSDANFLSAFYGDGDTIINLDNNPSALLQTGDQIFTCTGHYLGKVKRTADAVTDSTCDVTNGSASITCNASANVRIGVEVRGSISGFPDNAYVVSITTGTEGTDVTEFVISANFTGSSTNNVPLTFEHHIELEGASRKIIKSDGSAGLYHGYLYVVSDGTSTLAEQDYWDSFFRFHTKGRGGKDTFVSPTEDVETHMLQQMWNAAYHSAELEETTYTLIPYTKQPSYIGSSVPYGFFQIPYGVVEQADAKSLGPLSVNPIGLAINDDAYGTTDAGGAGTDIDANISAPTATNPTPKFLSSFTRNFIQLMGPDAIINPINNRLFAPESSGDDDSYSSNNTLGDKYNPIIALPPAFRTFYSTSASRVSTGLTINSMQDKRYLVTKTETPTSSGVLINHPSAGTYSAESTNTIQVDTVDAKTKFPVNSVVYDTSGNPVGKVRKVFTNAITFFEGITVVLPPSAKLPFSS